MIEVKWLMDYLVCSFRWRITASGLFSSFHLSNTRDEVTAWLCGQRERRRKRCIRMISNGAIAAGLRPLKVKDWEIVQANIDQPAQGLPDMLLNRADVLIWWGL